MRILTMICISMVALTGGCAVKPTPDNVTGLTTSMIAEKIKCESQDSIYELLDENLSHSDDPKILQIRDAIRADRSQIVLLKNYKILSSPEAKLFSRFDDTIIVYDFQLRMTEANNAGLGSNLAQPLTNSLQLIGIKAANNKTRENFRTFRITTNLREVMRKPDCKRFDPNSVNWEYPIAGKIGLKETFGSYYALARDNDLSKLKDWEGASPFVDTMKFTTTVSAEIDPSINVTSAGAGYYFRDVNGVVGASRVDEHQLAVGISLPVGTKYVRLGPATAEAVNFQVDRAIGKSQIFGLPFIDPLRALNRPQ